MTYPDTPNMALEKPIKMAMPTPEVTSVPIMVSLGKGSSILSQKTEKLVEQA